MKIKKIVKVDNLTPMYLLGRMHLYFLPNSTHYYSEIYSIGITKFAFNCNLNMPI